MRLNASQWKTIFLRIGERIEAEKEYLSELDRAIGDGDHGVSMSIGWQAVRSRIAELEQEENIGIIMKEISGTFLNAVGASVGPLYGIAFLKAGIAAEGKSSLADGEIADLWCAAVNGIRQLGKAEPGDKTMLDAWLPIAEALERAKLVGTPFPEALEEAAEAGRLGMMKTKEMQSKRGRSGRLGERSVGTIDPGAASAYLIFSTFVEACKELGEP